MAEPFIGEIRMFGGSYAPRGWVLCDGQMLSVAEQSTLYALISTTYGGDGRTTFAVPDLRGRIPIHAGTGPGLTPRREGQYGGYERITLSLNHMPTHNHTMAVGSRPTTNVPGEAYLANSPTEMKVYGDSSGSGELASDCISAEGGGHSVENMSPFQVVNFIMATEGLWPERP